MILGMGQIVIGMGHVQPAEAIKMNIYSYKITRDYGFAPNPFFGICTLATCKPGIRSCAQVGDWILAFGGKRTMVPDKLVCLMRVDETMTFDEYWNNKRFRCKKPAFDRSLKYCYGDNIYHHAGDGNWVQENSHHSKAEGTNYNNLKHDTHVDRVLISETYWYLGSNALKLPKKYQKLLPRVRNYNHLHSEELGFEWEDFQEWMKKKSSMGQHGLPCKWKTRKRFVRYKGE